MTQGVRHIDNEELRALIDEGVPLVDIRTAPEWSRTGVIPRSRLLTFFDGQGRADPQAFLEALHAFAPAGTPVAVICRSGARTIPVSHFLVEAGAHPTVYNVKSGILGWLGAGLPVEPPAQDPGAAP